MYPLASFGLLMGLNSLTSGQWGDQPTRFWTTGHLRVHFWPGYHRSNRLDEEISIMQGITAESKLLFFSFFYRAYMIFV